MIKLYRIEVDGHFHGGPPPRPWVARIDGIDERFGLRREFIRPLNDFRDAHVAWSGNTYGIVARFPLRAGHLYEVSRCRGRSSKRYVAREFYWLEGQKMDPRTPEEALAIAEGVESSEATILRVADSTSPTWVAEITGLGTPRRLGWVVVANKRLYRLRSDRCYEVTEDGQRRLVRVVEGGIETVSEADALAWMSVQRARSAA